MRNGVGEKFEKKSPGTSDTQKTKVLLTLKELGSNKNKDVDLKGNLTYSIYPVFVHLSDILMLYQKTVILCFVQTEFLRNFISVIS